MEQYKQNYDTLLHLHTESGLERAEVLDKARELFPGFNDIAIYDGIIGDYEIELYMDARAKGLSVEQAAHNAEVSHMVMTKVLAGEGISLDRFIRLIRAELFGQSQCINRLLNIISKAENNTAVNAATVLLEKIAPERYGKTPAPALEDPDKKRPILNFFVKEDDTETA